jgi:hypothetical protein
MDKSLRERWRSLSNASHLAIVQSFGDKEAGTIAETLIDEVGCRDLPVGNKSAVAFRFQPARCILGGGSRMLVTPPLVISLDNEGISTNNSAEMNRRFITGSFSVTARMAVCIFGQGEEKTRSIT